MYTQSIAVEVVAVAAQTEADHSVVEAVAFGVAAAFVAYVVVAVVGTYVSGFLDVVALVAAAIVVVAVVDLLAAG